MQLAPNQTVIEGLLLGFEAAADGYGGDVRIRVTANRTPDPATDFLQARSGEILVAFYAQPDPPATRLRAGLVVRAELTCLGGPFGERTVVQSLALTGG